MPVKFPLKTKTTDLGVVSDPVISIGVLTRHGYLNFDFLVDTGADYTMMPKTMAPILGIRLDGLPKVQFGGIEGKGVLTYITYITVKIDDKSEKMTCALSSNDQCPFILGRKDVFSKHSIFFDNQKKFIKFISI